VELDAGLERCPAIAAEVWPAVAERAAKDPQHPLSYLLTSDSQTAELVAIRTDRAVASIRDRDATWLAQKTATLRRASDSSATTSVLGEVRAYADLLSAFPARVTPNPRGCDFSISLEAESVGVEVYSPQHRSERANSEPEVSVRHGVRMELIETAPFGLPERSIDNVQGEAVSRIAQAKGDESQLQGHDAYVLWMDFQDPLLWALVPDLNQVRPFSTFRSSATSGVFWSAFYGRTGMPVFDSLSFDCGDHSIYKMEFDGRFSGASVLDFAVFGLILGTVAYQNPTRRTVLSDDFFRKLHLLPQVKPELCWLDWPARGRLADRVALAREELDAYVTFFGKL